MIATGLGPKTKYGQGKLERVKGSAATYAQGKLNPFVGAGVELIAQSNFFGQPLPWSSDKGSKSHPRLTWAQYLGSKAPIPVAEGVRTFAETAHEQGMPDSQIHAYLKAAVSMAGGALGVAVQPDKLSKEDKIEANKKAQHEAALEWDKTHPQ